MPELRTTAAKLQPGDFLLGSRQTVAARPTPCPYNRGRVRLAVITKHSAVRHVAWNARTTMTVNRPHDRELPAVQAWTARVLAESAGPTAPAPVDLSPAAIRRRLRTNAY